MSAGESTWLPEELPEELPEKAGAAISSYFRSSF
jgi:hypothetical protein